MENDTEPMLSRTSENILLQDTTSSRPETNSGTVEDSHVQTNEDDSNLHSTQNRTSSNVDREPFFVIVDSSCVSIPSSKEILTNKRNVVEGSINIIPKNKVIPIDTPCTSSAYTEFIVAQNRAYESVEELEMIDINLQSENEILIHNKEVQNEPESIVMAYLRDKNAILDNDEPTSTNKISSILEHVPKMETIPEGEQFSSFSVLPKEEFTPSSRHESNTDKNSID